ncbi:hypothetical protein FLAG1_05914, partial [Fusarium langsethiae]
TPDDPPPDFPFLHPRVNLDLE